MTDWRQTPVVPFPITEHASAAELARRLARTGFQGRMVGEAVEVWDAMLRGDVTIFLGLAGAMVPVGMRQVITYLIQQRLVDCLVSTGANLYHDLYESLGHPHWQTTPEADDVQLARQGLYRFYDILASEREFDVGEGFITEFSLGLDESKAYTTREYFYLLGQALAATATEEGILTAAAKAGVPIYCPALGDSAHGLAIAEGRARSGHRVTFDIIGDVLEMAQIVLEANKTGVVYIGGGTPKNFIQQAGVSAYLYQQERPGHSYGIQITTDQPQWGGLSGATFQEAQSWHKIAPDARFVTVNVEASVALPLIVSALAEGSADAIKSRKRCAFAFGRVPGA
ncbi:MAG: deoxyhypusine synthase family protein [Dehalococcoidia bacterium]